jgi:hypothetical protein
MDGHPRASVRGTYAFIVVAVLTAVARSILTPFYFFRYLAPIIPVLCIFAGGTLMHPCLHPATGIVGPSAILFQFTITSTSLTTIARGRMVAY